LIVKLTSGFKTARHFCQTNFWFCHFKRFFLLFFTFFMRIIKKNARIFEHAKTGPQEVRCKSNFWAH
ncbi:MAG: hypothetical protein IKO03_07865, partial [Lachnospiraceae bacterium]|nr:hypothetical protein [Lachnospiraceae bacterium]